MNETRKLEMILNSQRLKESNRSFVSSLFEQSKKKPLSDKQLAYVDKFWDECFPSENIIKEEKEWADNFSEEMKENTRIMKLYYKYHYSNSLLASRVDNENWIPPKGLYQKTIESAWATRIIGNYNSVPKFKVGDFCVLRDTQSNRSLLKNLMDIQLLVLDFSKDVKNEFNIEYTIIDPSKMEDQKMFSIRENKLNYVKNK